MSEELVLSGVLVLSKVIKKELIRRQNAKRKKRKVWVKPWVGRRTEYGASHTLLKELKNEDHTAYRNMLKELQVNSLMSYWKWFAESCQSRTRQ
ncbi:hypothetical protein TNCV_4081881 [Trichonephila clavipes]|nr:hypothetical protein TNCV_4081881 [Trichonephila clavipes]